MTTTLPPYRIYKNKIGADPAVSLLDFNDSFTFNIATYLGHLDHSFQIIPFECIDSFLKKRFLLHAQHALVFGPGPGHPDEYSRFFPSIKKLLFCDNLFHLGICLGHQIIGRILGDKVVRSKNPLHGQSVPLKVPAWESCFPKKMWGREIHVQRYNSLAIRREDESRSEREVLDEKGEVLIRSFRQVLSYQFHPESIGTSFPSLFFEPLRYFLYNLNHDKPNPARWSL